MHRFSLEELDRTLRDSFIFLNLNNSEQFFYDKVVVFGVEFWRSSYSNLKYLRNFHSEF